MNMKLKLAGLALSFLQCFAAQNLTLSVSPSSVAPGGSAVLTVGYTDASPSANVAAVGWVIPVPPNLTIASGTSVIAGKELSQNGNRFILIGSNPPANGALTSVPIATIPITVAASAPAGTISIGLTTVSAATTAGQTVAVTAPATITLTVAIAPSKYDLNSDGKVDINDVNIELQAELGATSCPAAYQVDGTTGCTVTDVMLIVLAALGVIH